MPGPTFVTTNMEINYIATNSKETRFQIKHNSYSVIRLDQIKKSLQECVDENPDKYCATTSPAGIVVSQMDEEIQKHGDGIKGFILYHCPDLVGNQLRVMTFLHRYQGIPMPSEHGPEFIVNLINSGLLHKKNIKLAQEEESKAAAEGDGYGDGGAENEEG